MSSVVVCELHLFQEIEFLVEFLEKPELFILIHLGTQLAASLPFFCEEPFDVLLVNFSSLR